MDHSSPEVASRSRGKTVLRLFPFAFATLATGVIANSVFPTMPATGATLTALAWAGAVAGFVASRAPANAVASPEPAAELLVDEETALGNARLLGEVLHREIARSARHGAPLTLTLFEIEVAPNASDEPLPSPAPFVARALVNHLRESDVVHRLDERHFAAVLTECHEEAARVIVDRVRTHLSSTPYARAADGSGVYARARAAALEWTDAWRTEQEFLAATYAALEAARSEYRAAAVFFEGPLNPAMKGNR